MKAVLYDKKTIAYIEEIIKNIGGKLRDPKLVTSIVVNKISSYDIKKIEYYYGWSGSDLANGLPGICCFIAELDKAFPNEGWDVVGHNYLVEIKKYIETQGIYSLSLWGGLTGICFATLALSRNRTRYKNLLDQLHYILIKQLPNVINNAIKNINQGVSMTDYDVIGGLTGIGRYLLYHLDNPEMKKLLSDILNYLITLAEDKEVRDTTVPGWYIPNEHQFLSEEKIQYPNGNFNLGFAHGISGCLALLSIAKIKGYEIDKQTEAINNIAEWLVKWHQIDEFGPLWPRRVSWEEFESNKLESKVSAYEAWCYGETGIARSIWLAGKALKNDDWKEIALQTFIGMYHRSKQNYSLISPTYCHGIAGTLHSVQLMLSECPREELVEYTNLLIELLLKHVDLDSPFGFKDVELIDGNIYKFDKPGLLNGAAGIAMVLLDFITANELEWDCVFLVK
ncbi:hypothetical protein ETC01_09100 [Geobacillus sp. NFOSA3]|nr:hypothetical protein [Geobacillus sp. NFOSA3]